MKQTLICNLFNDLNHDHMQINFAVMQLTTEKGIHWEHTIDSQLFMFFMLICNRTSILEDRMADCSWKSWQAIFIVMPCQRTLSSVWKTLENVTSESTFESCHDNVSDCFLLPRAFTGQFRTCHHSSGNMILYTWCHNATGQDIQIIRIENFITILIVVIFESLHCLHRARIIQKHVTYVRAKDDMGRPVLFIY